MSTPLLAAKTPCEIEARNFKRHYTEPAIGKVYRLSFEVEKATWDACELVPKSATIKGVIWWESEGADFVPSVPPQEPVKEPDNPPFYDSVETKNGYKYQRHSEEPKGAHGKYWSQLFKAGFQNYPDLIEAMDCAGDQIRMRLHDVFDVTSLTFVSPAQFEDFCVSKGLHSLITLSRQAVAKLQEQAA